jgi:hypothetical protein
MSHVCSLELNWHVDRILFNDETWFHFSAYVKSRSAGYGVVKSLMLSWNAVMCSKISDVRCAFFTSSSAWTLLFSQHNWQERIPLSDTSKPSVYLRTTRLTNNQFYFLALTVYLCVLLRSRNKPIISLYSINSLVFITEMECVYCAVRTESLNIIRVAKGHHSALFENEDCYCLFHQHWATCCTHNVTVAVLTVFFCKRSVSKFCDPLRSSDLTL